uniref:Nuclear receptor n=1 Tax=Brachionus koreanus TaxID=1199090 RepID=A0A221CB88_9BILA|nr:nuclear receptor [Brachionus koreanus]
MLLNEKILIATLSHENYLNQKRAKNFKYEAVFNFGKCKICCDKATGIHYGVASCEGCKGFFKRSLSKHKYYVCREEKNCKMFPKGRKKCKYCRWKLCVSSGMSLLDVRIGRIPNHLKEIKQKKEQTIKDQCSIRLWLQHFLSKTKLHRYNLTTDKILPIFDQCTSDSSSENQLIILCLLRDKTLQVFKEQTKDTEMSDLLSNSQVDQMQNEFINDLKKKYLAHLAMHVQSIFSIVYELPGFKNISKHDLKFVISEGFFSTLIAKTIKLFRNENIFYMLDEKTVLNSNLFELITSKLVKDLVFEFYTGLSELKLTDQEYALMIPIFLSKFNFSENMKEPQLLITLGEYYTKALVYEFSLNNRNREFLEKFAKIVSLAPKINLAFKELKISIN